MRVRAFEIAAIAMLAAASAHAAAPTVTVTEAWIRALPAHLPAGGYFKIHNSGKTDIALTGARSNACGMLMLHKSSNENGMTGMDDVSSIPVSAGATLAFTPGGYHLMCMDPKPALKPGVKIPVTLQFEGGQSVAAMFAVKDARGK